MSLFPLPRVGRARIGLLFRNLFNARAMRSFLTKANEDRGKERYRRASITATSSLISQGLTILISLISVPLTVGYLGPERYGVWLTMSSLLTWMAMTDFGLAGNALVNVIADATERDDRQLARQYAASAFWSLTAITLTMARSPSSRSDGFRGARYFESPRLSPRKSCRQRVRWHWLSSCLYFLSTC